MGYREDILSLPKSEQLGEALAVIELLTGGNDSRRAWVQDKYNLSPNEAKVILALSARAPETCTHDAIYASMYAGGADVEGGIVGVMICKLRKKGFKIITRWGAGYRLEEPLPLSGDFAPWTKQDDEDLETMVITGYSIREIAYELDRTERAVLERKRSLRLT